MERADFNYPGRLAFKMWSKRWHRKLTTVRVVAAVITVWAVPLSRGHSASCSSRQEGQTDGDKMSHRTSKCTCSLRLQLVHTSAICWPEVFWPGRKRPARRGSHRTARFTAGASSMPYRMGSQRTQTLEEVFAPAPFTRSHGEVSIHWINRSTDRVCHMGWQGMSVR